MSFFSSGNAATGPAARQARSEKIADEMKPLLEKIKAALGERVKEVRVTDRQLNLLLTAGQCAQNEQHKAINRRKSHCL